MMTEFQLDGMLAEQKVRQDWINRHGWKFFDEALSKGRKRKRENGMSRSTADRRGGFPGDGFWDLNSIHT
ncbi:hypothetical protein C8P63_11349 [Melghirimyces profundicolus]|uniref:Uncharacterized protein n=1 Tax=Melghirimyces profundicolus TaxID=1242148 RepID=A0A2T6BSR7_9BACL|nr:hypothetical protein [Melghirimyces profundicolus]PTX59104.1 hypothetical protein C8P63_11349 [Melghirimyces profundicolus]